MLTKLETSLGMAQLGDPGTKLDFLILALKGKCAGDTYYYDMDQSTFDDIMKDDHKTDFYRFYARQRKIGVHAFQGEVSDELSALSGIELDSIIKNHNYDSGTWLLSQIIAQSKCEFATAFSIYWAYQPSYFYKKYSTLDLACQDTNNVSHDAAQLLRQIEYKTKLGAFLEILPVPDVGCFLDEHQPDYSVKPFENIPDQLRVYF